VVDEEQLQEEIDGRLSEWLRKMLRRMCRIKRSRSMLRLRNWSR
jgi:hypothetical protein